MKAFALLFAFLGFAAATAQPLIINKENYGTMPTAEVRDTIHVVATPVPRATVGIDQTWDYSMYNELDTTYVNVRTPSTLSQFPNSYARLNLFENLTPDRGYNYDRYIAITDTGVVSLGYNTSAQAWNIGEFTMGANDSIFIQNYTRVYDDPILITPFPWMYGGSTESSEMIETNGLINVQAMGMTGVPIGKRSYIITRDTVVGWGNLILPVGSWKSKRMPVLLINSTTEVTDSIFVNGEPAPIQFLMAFGLTQGQYTESNSQIFMRAGELNAVATLIFTNEEQDSTEYFMYHSKLEPDQGSVFEGPLTNSLKAYPNPVSSELTIELEGETSGRAFINIVNASGASVARTTTEANSIVKFDMPSSLSPGAYFIIIRSENGKILGAGSVIKN